MTSKMICDFKVSMLVLFFAGLVCVQTAGAKSMVNLYWDNDSRFHKPYGNTDRHYTNGTKFTYVTDEVPRWEFLEYLGNWSFGDSPATETNIGFFAGQDIYTPDFADYPSLRHDPDMKFAGWLYGGLFMQRANTQKREHVEFNFGVIGPSAHGDDVQNGIHEFVGSEKTIGWENQIKDEPTFDFKYNVREKLPDGFLVSIPDMQTMVEYGLTAGTVHRHAELGFIARYPVMGEISEMDFGPGRLTVPDGLFGRDTGKSALIYLFSRVNGSVVQFNRFLTGLDHETFFGSVQFGLTYQYKRLEFGYSRTYFTSQFRQQHGNDSIGAFTLSWLF